MDVRVGLLRMLNTEELMLLNCGVGEDSWEPFGQQGDPSSPSWRKSVLNIHWKDWCWSWNFSTLATWCEELTHWKWPLCWERLKVGREGETEDQMVGWHHQLDGHESEKAPGVGDGQGSLACCSSWGHKESDTIEQLNWRVTLLSNDVLISVWESQIYKCQDLCCNEKITNKTEFHRFQILEWIR